MRLLKGGAIQQRHVVLSWLLNITGRPRHASHKRYWAALPE